MNAFNIDAFINELRSLATLPQAKTGIYARMVEVFQRPDAMAESIPGYPDNDTILFEDDSISIWHCRFPAGVHVPPHDHQITAMIGVYKGVEENRFYLSQNGKLIHKATKKIGCGEVATIEPDTIHSVSTLNNQPSYAIHVYLGPVSTVPRSLFDWETGQAYPFTDAAYHQAIRSK